VLADQGLENAVVARAGIWPRKFDAGLLDQHGNMSTLRLSSKKIGGGWASKVEPNGALHVSTIRGVSWTRNTIDLTELARLRWVEGKNLNEIAAFLEVSRSTVDRGMRGLRQSGRKLLNLANKSRMAKS